jgi:hypothetical protein
MSSQMRSTLATYTNLPTVSDDAALWRSQKRNELFDSESRLPQDIQEQTNANRFP